MSQCDFERAAAIIGEACATGRLVERLPGDCTPQTIEDAYAIQNHIFAARVQPTCGWFVAATNPDMQRKLGLNDAYAARWGTGRFLDSGAVISAPGELPIALEAEITFRLARDLPPRKTAYRLEQVERAVGAVHASFEVVISCFSDWMNQAPLNLIAEGGPAQYLVLGAGLEDWRSLDLREIPVTVRVNDAEAAEGRGGNVMDGPLSVLLWLANHASARGTGLSEGQLCNTGMCTAVCPVGPGDHAVADFGSLGQVEVFVADGGQP